MKDKEIRKRFDDLEEKVDWHYKRSNESSRIFARQCPKCQHPTPQTEVSGSLVTGHPYDYLCLVCGSKLQCVTETVCKVIEEEKC